MRQLALERRPLDLGRTRLRLAYRPQLRDDLRTVGRRPRPAGAGWPSSPRRRAVQQPDRVFPVIARVAAEFIQDDFLPLAIRLPIARVNRLEVFPSRASAHRNPPRKVSIRVTSKMARRDTFLNDSTRA